MWVHIHFRYFLKLPVLDTRKQEQGFIELYGTVQATEHVIDIFQFLFIEILMFGQ